LTTPTSRESRVVVIVDRRFVTPTVANASEVTTLFLLESVTT